MIIDTIEQREIRHPDGGTSDHYTLSVVVDELARSASRGSEDVSRGDVVAPAWTFYLVVGDRDDAELNWSGHVAVLRNGAWQVVYPGDTLAKSVVGIRLFEVIYTYNLRTGSLKIVPDYSDGRPSAADRSLALQILKQQLPWRGPEARGNPRRRR